MKRVIGSLVVCAVMAAAASAEPTYEVNTEKRSESLRKDALHMFVIGGVTLALSAGFALAAHDKWQQIENQDPNVAWPNDLFYLEREGHRLETLGNVTLVLGGAFLATSALCYWRSRVAASEEQASVTVAPMASASSAGVAFSGSF
ncbi:MAG: hypothetical protein AB7T06_26975 [Kofleriaceae bacterium]